MVRCGLSGLGISPMAREPCPSHGTLTFCGRRRTATSLRTRTYPLGDGLSGSSETDRLSPGIQTLPMSTNVRQHKNARVQVYFEERLGVKMTHTLQGRRHLLYLWKHQHGLCPVCHQKITRLTGWHNHHIVWRTHGCRDTTENRVLLHPNCHRQVHSQALDVAPPRSAR